MRKFSQYTLSLILLSAFLFVSCRDEDFNINGERPVVSGGIKIGASIDDVLMSRANEPEVVDSGTFTLY